MDIFAVSLERLSPADAGHVANVAENLQLAADLGYGDVTLLLPDADASLRVIADARPMTAAAAIPHTRVGETVTAAEEPEAYDTLASGHPSCGTRRHTRWGFAYTATAHPIGSTARPVAVIVRHVSQAVAESPGKMELALMRLAELLLDRLQSGPILDLDTGAPYATTRLAGDGVIEVAADGGVAYASPNAVTILRLAGAAEEVIGTPVSELPGGSSAVAPVLGTGAAREMVLEVHGRSLRFRTVALAAGALVLVEDVTEARRREQELRVKEVTIREVHHRVKNNLQTVASLLRIQARRSSSAEARHALLEAVERVSSMAVVHEMLAESAEESVDLAEAVRTVVGMVARGLVDADAHVDVRVAGSTGLVPAQVATSLALVAAELVHNSIEHGLAGRPAGTVTVDMQRAPSELTLTIADSGVGLPADFSPEGTANLGLAIVRTIVEDDLHGTLAFDSGTGTTVTVTVPVPVQPR